MKQGIVLIVLLSIFLTGCSTGVSKEEYNDLKTDFDELQEEQTNIVEEKSEIEKDYEELNDSFENLQNDLVSLQNNDIGNMVYGVGRAEDIAFCIPSTWEVVENDNTIYYYPEDGVLMVQISDTGTDTTLIRESLQKEMLGTFSDAIIASSTNYIEIESRFIDTSFGSVAKEISYYSDYDGITYENKTFAFAYKYLLYTFTFAQPNELKDSDLYDNIINSIIIIK